VDACGVGDVSLETTKSSRFSRARLDLLDDQPRPRLLFSVPGPSRHEAALLPRRYIRQLPDPGGRVLPLVCLIPATYPTPNITAVRRAQKTRTASAPPPAAREF